MTARPKRKATRFKCPLRTEGELRAFVSTAFGVLIPDKRVCPDHSTPWEAFRDAYFAVAPMILWEGSRGFAGKSFLLALLTLTEAITLKAEVNVLGGSGEQSERVIEYMTALWESPSAPRRLLLGDVKREQRLVYGNKVRSLMASTKSVRGPHPQRLRLDEIDEMDPVIFDASMGQTMTKEGVPAPPQTVGSSTHQYPAGTMTMAKTMAAEKGWPVYTWCYRETMEPHGWLAESEIALKKIQVSSAMWDSEYELQEPSPEGRAIDSDAVKKMFDTKLGDYQGKEGEYIEIEPPKRGHTYASGADWARKNDRTEIGTFRIHGKSLMLVAYEWMNRRAWPVMVGRFDRRVERFPGKASHDGTGIGDVVDGFIKVDAESIMMVGRPRTDLLSNVIAAIERGEIKAPMIKFLYNQLLYVTNDDVYGSGHLPDGLSMLALAYDAAVQPEWQDGRYN